MADYQHEVVDHGEGHMVFVRVPTAEPDAVADLERAAEEFPPWLAGQILDVYLVGRRRIVRVPGYSAHPILSERLRADAHQAANLRARLGDDYDSITYRSAGDPLRLLRLGVRVPCARVAAIDDEQLDGIAFVTGHLLDSRQHEAIEAVLLVADEDHLRIRPPEFFEDVLERRQASRKRPERRQRAPEAVPQDPPAVANGGFPSPPQRIEAAGPPRRRVETVEPVLELEEEVEAAADATPARMMARVDAKRLELASQLVVRLLKLAGFQTLTDVWHAKTRYAAAGERAHGTPRKVAVRVLDSPSRRDVDEMVMAARSLGADQLVAIVTDVSPRLAARAEGTRVRLVRPEDVGSLTF